MSGDQRFVSLVPEPNVLAALQSFYGERGRLQWRSVAIEKMATALMAAESLPLSLPPGIAATVSAGMNLPAWKVSEIFAQAVHFLRNSATGDNK